MKSLFLGPQSENGPWVRDLLVSVLDQWFSWRTSVFPQDGRAISAEDQKTSEFVERLQDFSQNLGDLIQRFESEIPKFSPRYIGHMFSEISLPALFGHIITLLHNPNNISEESSRVGVAIEREAIAALCQMIGYPPDTRGHFTSGGTLANIEAMLRARMRFSRWLAAGAEARGQGVESLSLFTSAHMGWDNWDRLHEQLNPRDTDLERLNILESEPWAAASRIARVFQTDSLAPVVLIPGHAHYSWKKAAGLLGLGERSIWSIELDATGALSLPDLKRKVERARTESRPILMIVSVLGSTELGKFDPIHEINEYLLTLRTQEGVEIWHHVDAAYGGFFCSLDRTNEPETSSHSALRAVEKTDSITLDPHKLGYVPYSSGAFLCSNTRNYTLPRLSAPYIQYTGTDPGQVTIEGSRSAAGAVATYLTARTIGLDGEGYGRILRRTIQVARHLATSLAEARPEIRVAPAGECNVLCFHVAGNSESLSSSNRRTLALYTSLMSDQGCERFFVSKTHLTLSSYDKYVRGFANGWNGQLDTDHLSVIRLCLMNPFIGSKEMNVDFVQEFTQAVKSRISRQNEKVLLKFPFE